MKSKKVEFTPPEGAVPEGTGVGDTFDLVCSFELKKDGSACITMMGDVPMPGYDKSGKYAEEEDKYRPGFKEEAEKMRGIMMAGGDTATAE